MESRGFLAVWTDVAPDLETDYLHWLTREHTTERLGVDGFLAVRVFRAHRGDFCRVFILYELRSAAVLDSAAYLARLNKPTPWTQRTMANVQNFVRGGGKLAIEVGTGQGGVLVPLRLDTDQFARCSPLLAGPALSDRMVAIRLYVTDQARTAVPTQEKNLRQDDRSFDGLVLLEGLDRDSVLEAHRRLAQLLRNPGMTPTLEPELYSQIFRLG